MPEHYSSFGEAAGAAMAHNARQAARRNAERGEAVPAPPAAPDPAADDPALRIAAAVGPVLDEHPEHSTIIGHAHVVGEVTKAVLAALGLITTAPADGATTTPGTCPQFVPDEPRAPGLCATCGDSKTWHQNGPAPAADADGLTLTGHTIDIGWDDDQPLPARLYLAVHPDSYHDPAQLAADLRAAIAGTVPVRDSHNNHTEGQPS